MSVIRVPPVLREDAGGAREVRASGSTVRELLEDLSTQLPMLGRRIYDGEQIRPFVNVYVDGEDVRTLGGLDVPVRDDSTVVLLPAMAGGGGAIVAESPRLRDGLGTRAAVSSPSWAAGGNPHPGWGCGR
ncbi:MAG TPA: MoaD/ThiS family protein [Gaiellaceae bacterium]|nr:MoaD/ThiS family protein [Gaiellaceae bacterium]